MSMTRDQPDPTSCVSVVIGLGEVGRPLLAVLQRVYRVEGIDLPARDVHNPVDLMHVCYPAEVDDFVGMTAAYAQRYRPEIVVESLAELADMMDRSHWRPSWRSALRREPVAV